MPNRITRHHKRHNRHNRYGHNSHNTCANYYGEPGWSNCGVEFNILELQKVIAARRAQARAARWGRLPNDEGDFFEQEYPRGRYFNSWQVQPN